MSLFNRKTTTMLLASTILLSLSACATRPVIDPDSRVGQASEKLGEVGSQLWSKTKHVFRLDGTDAYHGPEAVAKAKPVEMPGQYKDEVDLVLVEDEFDSGPGQNQGQNQDIVLSAVNRQHAELLESKVPAEGKVPVIEIVSMEESTESVLVEDPMLNVAASEAPTLAPNSTLSSEQVEVEPSKPLIVTKPDLQYKVQPNENLWDISKRLTGDATNWQQLAALNSLDNNGTVFGGQTLQIPGDMLKDRSEPSLAAAQAVTLEPDMPQVDDSQAAPQLARLTVPASSAVETVSEIVVAEAANSNSLAPASPSTSVKVQAGESMWELAKRTTGDATNWKVIAETNGMSPEEAALIKYGQSLEVPTDLLKKADANPTHSLAAETAEKTLDEVTEVAADTQIQTPVVAADATNQKAQTTTPIVAENRPATAPTGKNKEENMTIMPANFQSDPPVIKTAEPKIAAAEEEKENWVMVSGTYYPKAIYNDANFSATLLTRVSPGTKLQVSRAIGPWFEVKTDRGVGYVHSRDIK